MNLLMTLIIRIVVSSILAHAQKSMNTVVNSSTNSMTIVKTNTQKDNKNKTKRNPSNERIGRFNGRRRRYGNSLRWEENDGTPLPTKEHIFNSERRKPMRSEWSHHRLRRSKFNGIRGSRSRRRKYTKGHRTNAWSKSTIAFSLPTEVYTRTTYQTYRKNSLPFVILRARHKSSRKRKRPGGARDQIPEAYPNDMQFVNMQPQPQQPMMYPYPQPMGMGMGGGGMGNVVNDLTRAIDRQQMSSELQSVTNTLAQTMMNTMIFAKGF